MKIGNRDFKFGKKTYIMGILNITPDSFSDGGSYENLEIAIKRVREMIEQGADIIDVGGESTRPNHLAVEEIEEMKRVIPVIKEIKAQLDIPISIDTYKSNVALEGIRAGASLVNDVWGFKKDANMAKVVAENDVACCIMHNKENTNYTNIIENMIEDIKESIKIALNAGVKSDKIIIDPGIGFGKTYEQNLIVMKYLERFKELEYPLLLGTSRKSLIGNTLNLPPEKRIEGTLATTVIGIMKRCDFIRVHDIRENKLACTMTEAILNIENLNN